MPLNQDRKRIGENIYYNMSYTDYNLLFVKEIDIIKSMFNRIKKRMEWE